MGATATGAPGPAGFALSLDQQLWLVAVPSGVGAFLRLPYTFAVPLFGGRNWTVVSALLLSSRPACSPGRSATRRRRTPRCCSSPPPPASAAATSPRR
jgi:hypothetical protein